MYAYCNNNAVNLVDTTGTLPFGIGPMTVAINDGGGGISIELSIDVFIRQRRKSKAEEKDSSGNYTLNAKIIQTTQAFERNFVILMSVGLGLYGGVIATEYASLDAGLYYDLLRIEYSNGILDSYQYFYQGLDGNLLIFNYGFSEERRRPINGKGRWKTIESVETLPVFGIGAYVFGGGSIALGFDLNAFISDISSIWGL